MTSDKIIQELGRLEKKRQADEQQRLPEAWDDLAAGRLAKEDAEQLRETTDPEIANDAWQAFQPLDREFKDQLKRAAAQQISGSLGAPTLEEDAPVREETERAAPTSPPIDPAPSPPAAVASGVDVAPTGPSRHAVIQMKPNRLRRWHLWMGTATVFAAASLALLLLPLGGPALPLYEPTLTGQVATFRGPADDLPDTGVEVFALGNSFGLVLTPGTAVAGEIVLRGYIDSGSGPEHLALPAHELSDLGAVRLHGVIGEDINLPSGDSTLYLLAGRSRSLPDPDELAERLADTGKVRTDHWQAWRFQIRVE